MSINSRQKGAKGERELASKLRDYEYDCRRGQQYNGLEGEDVVDLDYIHIEVKRVQALNLDDAMDQAKRDSKANQLPTVFHRKNNKKWKVTMELDDWIKLYNEYYSSMKLKEREKYTIHLTDEEYRKVIDNAQKDVANDSVIAHRFVVMQKQLDEKDKRIQELEEESKKYIVQLTDEQYRNLVDKIRKKAKQEFEQKVKDKIAEYDKRMEEDAGHPNWVITDRIVMNVLQELLEGEK